MRYHLVGTDCPDGMSEARYKEIADYVSRNRDLMQFQREPEKWGNRYYNVFIKILHPEGKKLDKAARIKMDLLNILFELDK